ncbi:MAG: hypothetical protein HEQ35_31500 [Gloeotrichia echinulata IR180]|nr:hypothetical protein [Gloeotrichia echinulata DEX184]
MGSVNIAGCATCELTIGKHNGKKLYPVGDLLLGCSQKHKYLADLQESIGQATAWTLIFNY